MAERVFKPRETAPVAEIVTPDDFHAGVHNLVRRAVSINPEISRPPLLRRLKEGVKLKNELGTYDKKHKYGWMSISADDLDLERLPEDLRSAISEHIGGLKRLTLSARHSDWYSTFDHKVKSSISLNKDGLYSPVMRSLSISCVGDTFRESGYTPGESLRLGGQLIMLANSLLDAKLLRSHISKRALKLLKID